MDWGIPYQPLGDAERRERAARARLKLKLVRKPVPAPPAPVAVPRQVIVVPDDLSDSSDGDFVVLQRRRRRRASSSGSDSDAAGRLPARARVGSRKFDVVMVPFSTWTVDEARVGQLDDLVDDGGVLDVFGGGGRAVEDRVLHPHQRKNWKTERSRVGYPPWVRVGEGPRWREVSAMYWYSRKWRLHCWVGPSRLLPDSLGLFAGSPFAAGELVCIYFGETVRVRVRVCACVQLTLPLLYRQGTEEEIEAHAATPKGCYCLTLPSGRPYVAPRVCI